MSIADKLKGLVFEEEFGGSKKEAPPVARALPPGQPFIPRTIPVPDGVSLDGAVVAAMRKNLVGRMSTAAGWLFIVEIRDACAALAEFVPDKKQQLRAALKTRGMDQQSLIQTYTGVLNVLASEDVRFRKALDEERSKSKPLQDKNIEGVKVSLAAAKQRVADLTDELESLRAGVTMLEERLSASEAAFASALDDVRKETNDELEQLKSLK